MIIWINGPNGIGKSHVALELAKRLIYRNAEYVDSDNFWLDWIKHNDEFTSDFVLEHIREMLSGLLPYENRYFLNSFREILEEMVNNCAKVPVVSFSLVNKICETELLEYFEHKNQSMFHFILEAEKETIVSRIENDPIRSKGSDTRKIQKDRIAWQQQYLKYNYPNAVRINTDNRSIAETVDEIISYVNLSP